MKKQSVAAAIMLISAAAVSAVTIAFNSAERTPPDFVFSDPSPAAVPTATPEPSTDPAPPPAETAETTEPQSPLPTVTTTSDPENFSTITFDGFDIIIEGVSADRSIVSACLYSDGREEAAEYDGDSYRIVLKDKKHDTDFETVYITAGDTPLNYRISAAPDGFKPLNTSDIAAKNLRLAEAPAALPSEGVLQYITPDGDPSGAREIMARAEEISDRICEGIPDDYGKARAISQWISENIYYDFDASTTGVTTETVSLSHVLEKHRTVCGGFSNLFSALCAAQGITVYNIQGDAINDVQSSYAEADHGNIHEWNYAVINGRGVWVDACWDTYNYYKDGVYKQDGTRLKYFDITNTVLSYDHRARLCWSRDYYAALEE